MGYWPFNDVPIDAETLLELEHTFAQTPEPKAFDKKTFSFSYPDAVTERASLSFENAVKPVGKLTKLLPVSGNYGGRPGIGSSWSATRTGVASWVGRMLTAARITRTVSVTGPSDRWQEGPITQSKLKEIVREVSDLVFAKWLNEPLNEPFSALTVDGALIWLEYLLCSVSAPPLVDDLCGGCSFPRLTLHLGGLSRFLPRYVISYNASPDGWSIYKGGVKFRYSKVRGVPLLLADVTLEKGVGHLRNVRAFNRHSSEGVYIESVGRRISPKHVGTMLGGTGSECPVRPRTIPTQDNDGSNPASFDETSATTGSRGGVTNASGGRQFPDHLTERSAPSSRSGNAGARVGNGAVDAVQRKTARKAVKCKPLRVNRRIEESRTIQLGMSMAGPTASIGRTFRWTDARSIRVPIDLFEGIKPIYLSDTDAITHTGVVPCDLGGNPRRVAAVLKILGLCTGSAARDLRELASKTMLVPWNAVLSVAVNKMGVLEMNEEPDAARLAPPRSPEWDRTDLVHAVQAGCTCAAVTLGGKTADNLCFLGELARSGIAPIPDIESWGPSDLYRGFKALGRGVSGLTLDNCTLQKETDSGKTLILPWPVWRMVSYDKTGALSHIRNMSSEVVVANVDNKQLMDPVLVGCFNGKQVGGGGVSNKRYNGTEGLRSSVSR